MQLKSNLFTVVTVLVCCVASQTQAARILGLFASPSKSHLLIHCTIADTLAQAGHEVTVLANVPNILTKAKYNFIHVGGALYDSRFANEMVNKPASTYVNFHQIITSVIAMTNSSLNSPTMKEFLRTHKEGDFDVILLGYCMNDFILGIAAHFKCPVIVSFMVQPIFSVNSMIANPLLPSYVPSLFSGLKQPMDFWSRLQNMFGTAVEEGFLMNVLKWNTEKLYR